MLAFGIAPLSIQLVAYGYGLGSGFTLLPWMLAGIGLVAFLAALSLPRGGASPAPVAPVAAE